MKCTLYFMTNICEMQGRWQISHGRHKSLSPMAECDITRLPMAMTPRKCILNKSWKQWLLLFCPFMCQCNASWSYWSIAVSCTRLKGKCPFSQPSATNLHLNASILTTSDQPCVPRTYFLNQIKSGQKKEFIETSSWHIETHCLRILIFCVQGMRSFPNAACGVNIVCFTQIKVLRSTSIKRQLEWAQHETTIQRDTLK